MLTSDATMRLVLFYWSSPDPTRQAQLRHIQSRLKALQIPFVPSVNPGPADLEALPFDQAWVLVGPEVRGQLDTLLLTFEPTDRRFIFLLQSATHKSLLPDLWSNAPIHILSMPGTLEALVNKVKGLPPPPPMTPATPLEDAVLPRWIRPAAASLALLLVALLVINFWPKRTLENPAVPPTVVKDTYGIEWLQSILTKTWMTRGEISVGEYRACVKSGLCGQERSHPICNHLREGREHYVANCISFMDAQNFCAARGARLPTYEEFQAEATRDGTAPYPWGEEKPTCRQAMMADRAEGVGCGKGGSYPTCTRPAGRSISGFCDMVGNVMEWTAEGSLVSSSAFWDGQQELLITKNLAGTGINFTARKHENPLEAVQIPIEMVGFRCAKEK